MKSLVLIFVTLLACEQVANGYRILAVIPLPGRSHFIMMEELFLSLARKGHQIDVASHFPQKKPVPNYTDISLQGTAELATNNISVSETSSFASFSMSKFAGMAGDKVCSLLETPQIQQLIKNPPKDPPYDLVIIEMFMANCYLAFGRQLGVPIIGIAASSLLDWYNDPLGNPHNPAVIPSVFSASSTQMTFYERLKNTMLTNVVVGQINYYIAGQEQIVRKHFDIEFDHMNDFYQDIGLILVNSHHTLHGVRPFSTGTKEVAGIHIGDVIEPLTADVQKWLDDSKHGCVFFTFGSMVRIETLPDNVLRDIYKVFEKIAPVRVLMKVAKKEELLEGLPKNVMVKSWFNQKAILNHTNTKAFITHGGLMGTLESIHFGVPMVGIPLFGDQYVNILSYVNKKVAVSLGSLNNITEESLTNALNIILKDKTYSENIKKLSALFKDRPMSAKDTGIYWIEYVARRGMILRSPAVYLNWFQRNLVDVYGFLLACLLIALFVVYRILKFVLRMVCPKGCHAKKDKVTSAKKNK